MTAVDLFDPVIEPAWLRCAVCDGWVHREDAKWIDGSEDPDDDGNVPIHPECDDEGSDG